jgi:deazaflavin-dependent oxidoreductase (nitroreductase family)
MLPAMNTGTSSHRLRATPKYLGIALAAIAALAGAWVFVLPKTNAWYRNGRPTRFGKLTNRTIGRWAARGIPAFGMVTLEVPGRRTGRMTSTVLVLLRHGGREYLVSMLGERSDWVYNVRARQGRAVVQHGRSRPVTLVEVPVSERAPILSAYLRGTPGARPHFPLRTDAPVEAFEPLAGAYPVFEIVDAQGDGKTAANRIPT